MRNVVTWLKRQWQDRRRTVLLVATVVIASAAVTAAAVARESDDLPDGVALRMGDKSVTEDQLDHRVRVLRALYGIERPAGGKELDAFNRDAAHATALSLILDDAAAEEDVLITDQAVEAALEELIATQYGADGHQQFIQVLGREGASETDVKQELARQLRIDQLYAVATAGVGDTVIDEDLRAYYAANEREMVTPEKRRISNIVVGDEAAATQVLKALRRGSSFASLARRSSLDESTRARGGDLGLLTKDMLEPDYARLAFAADRGRAFGPVQTSYGWNVGVVVAVQPSSDLSFEQAEPSLRAMLVGQASMEAWRSWLTERIRAAKVQYAPAYEPSNPLDPPGEMPSLPLGEQP